MAHPYNTAPLATTIPGTFSTLAEMLRILQPYRNYRIAERRQASYAISGLLGNLGVAGLSDQLLEQSVYVHLVRKTSRIISFICGLGIFLLLGRRRSWIEVVDFRCEIPRRIPRYAAMIAPMGIRGGAQNLACVPLPRWLTRR